MVRPIFLQSNKTFPIYRQQRLFIGVEPIMQVTHSHMVNKNSNIQGRSLNVIKVIFNTIRNCSLRKEFAPSGSKFFPLREVPILKRDSIEENHCLIQ